MTADGLGAEHAARVDADADAARRAAAIAAPRVPRKFVVWAAVAVVVLAGGGMLLERVFTSAGLNSYSITASSSARQASKPATVPLRSFMGITAGSGALAPALSLTDQRGRSVTLESLRGRVVVLTFFDAACDDICPVLGAEIRRAESQLGAKAPTVAFVAVNTDPRTLSVAATARTSSRLGLASQPNWYFLTGSLASLDTVWTHYGITVEVARATHQVAHTELMIFLDRTLHERIEATPVGDQKRGGSTTLPAASIVRFGDGIATYARTLLH
ncbi:MAG TPA: SCO family protein [Acidimicrobiales bacterium]|nr:SCO family protein [Acidimicrobiales bacterium]